MQKIVRICQGLPGSGKDYWIQHQGPSWLSPLWSSYSICCADDYHMDEKGNYNYRPENAAGAHRQCFLKYEEALVDPEITHVYVSNTNTRMWELAPYYRLAEVRNLDVRIVTFLCPLVVSINRNVHNVPIPTLLAMDKALKEEVIPAFWKREFVVVQDDGSHRYFPSLS